MAQGIQQAAADRGRILREAAANDTPYGLAASVWTRDPARGPPGRPAGDAKSAPRSPKT